MVAERRFSYEKGTKASDWEATARRFPLRPGLHEEIRRRLHMRLPLEGGCEESAGLERPGKGKPAKVPEGAPAQSEYEAMGKDEPTVEPMSRDMEVARLKKAAR